MDPQQRFLLEVSYHALKNGKHPDRSFWVPCLSSCNSQPAYPSTRSMARMPQFLLHHRRQAITVV